METNKKGPTDAVINSAVEKLKKELESPEFAKAVGVMLNMPAKNKLVLVQGKVPERLVIKVRKILDDNGWTWNDFYLASMESFIQEWRDKGKN